MQVDVINKDGQTAGQIELDDEVFGYEPNEHVMHQAVVAHLARKRQGTHKTKIRGEVRGGGRKPWRQKGRGTARAGSTRSPIWVGGGTIHGPKPHKYNVKMPRKLVRIAKKSAYSLRLQENNLSVLEDFTFDNIKTKEMAKVLKNLNLDHEKSVLVLLKGNDNNILLSGRNIPNLTVKSFDTISTYDLLRHKKIVLFKGAIEPLVNAFKN
jgi:large subunit ribosomal protein L4